jgi:hypothetical protein
MKARKRTPPRRSAVAWGEQEAQACRDYLHAYVVDGEYEAACRYEYARESFVLRLTARKPDKLHLIAEKYGPWIVQYPWCSFWQCRSFPRKAWNHLSGKERTGILDGFAPRGIRPLCMVRVGTLSALGVFEMFKDAAEAAPDQDPILELPDRLTGTLAVFNLDFSETPKRMLARFKAWRDLPANRRRFAARATNPIGTTGTFKDRLKDLAVWRLYDNLGFGQMLQFADEHRKESQPGQPRPFHDARRDQDPASQGSRNQTALYAEQPSASIARARANKFLAKMISWEFGELAAEREAAEREIVEYTIRLVREFSK